MIVERRLPRWGRPAASSYLPEAFTSDSDRLADREMAFKELEVEDEHIKEICLLMEEVRDR